MTHGLTAKAEKGAAMSLLPVDLGELINRPARGPMRDESDQVPNFTDHLDTISRDLIFGRPKIVTL